MTYDIIASSGILASGFFSGLVFGFLLQRGGVSDFNVIVKQFLLKDFTVIKIMLTAMVVGGFGIYSLYYSGMIPALSVSERAHMGVLVGGLIFGVGMAILGLCPGTCVAAAGQGSSDAWYGLLGMLIGALIFIPQAAWFHETLSARVLTPVLTLSALTGVSPFLLLALLLVVIVVLYKMIKN